MVLGGVLIGVLIGHIPGATAGEAVTRGTALHYADSLAGRPTASGETYHPEALTAAHPTIALGTRLKVTNLNTGKSVVVKVNDRGPFGLGQKVLDLSRAAFRLIQSRNSGKIPISFTRLP
ncbi:MAG: septal ring lytic transglycosylase RlpA family protein [Gemmatimonadaceae bacterium]|nr:septal ring lytic transglycosylase RlpA family protein [Gloeobacterales cyanobacterium ES-bin-141]